MTDSISKVNSLPIKEYKSHQLTEMNQLLLDNRDHLYELINLAKKLQELKLLTKMNETLSSQNEWLHSILNHMNHGHSGSSMNSDYIKQLMTGVKKGLEEGAINLDSGKDINAFQLMKLLKDPDINRALNFLLHFFKGMGKSL
jgi:uncharacterized protein YjgD (DUF1641 family)